MGIRALREWEFRAEREWEYQAAPEWEFLAVQEYEGGKVGEALLRRQGNFLLAQECEGWKVKGRTAPEYEGARGRRFSTNCLRACGFSDLPTQAQPDIPTRA